MRREKAFSKDGFYLFVLEANIMLHDNVAKYGQAVLSEWLAKAEFVQPIKLLDLACGGYPVSISRMMGGCPETTFHYTGIDINPDQVEAARKFAYPNNVRHVEVLEGNAWDLDKLELADRFDVIFTGMNLHHGTPEEIHAVFEQCSERLAMGGLFMNHDFYRPPGTPYLRRPQANPRNPAESFEMISRETLASFPMMQKSITTGNESGTAAWKNEFLERYQIALRNKGADDVGIQEVVTHVSGRDYPLSVSEVSDIAKASGFN